MHPEKHQSESRLPIEAIRGKIRPPLAIVLGAPADVAGVLNNLPQMETVCYQLDLHPAARLGQLINQDQLAARVITAADLWDLPQDFQTAFYPAPTGGERGLKLDLIEQAFHVLRPGGCILVSSPYTRDTFFPPLLKKIFGRVHISATAAGRLFWCHRETNRPRRRHEVVFHARVGDGPSLRFLSRPGVFSYGRFDDGARAPVESMSLAKGSRVLDLGCGCGTNGIFAGLRSGPDGHVTFLDSNLRAVALAEHNAHWNGLENFQAIAALDSSGLGERSFDVVLANPPYYAFESIARMFIESARVLLRPGGKLYLVTKQVKRVQPLVTRSWRNEEIIERRGYSVIIALK
jgi:23S rRNA (guanine1835-N2)-methyltransferase